MTQVSYSGSGTTAVKDDQIGTGQGLQIGDTDIDFSKGIVHLQAVGGTAKIGNFRGLVTKNNDKLSVKSLVFKAKTRCLITIDDSVFVYETLGEYLTFNHIDITTMKIHRDATGQNPDVFDWQFIASSDPEYKFTIQKANRDAESEVIFASAARVNTGGDGAGNYTQTTNLRGAKKIDVSLETANIGGETGNVTISAEIFDPAANKWKTLIPATDLFGANTPKNQSLVQPVGDTISQNGASGDNSNVVTSVPAGSSISKAKDVGGLVGFVGLAAVVPAIGFVLPSGDNIFRFKAAVAVGTLTFSLSIIKVFD